MVAQRSDPVYCDANLIARLHRPDPPCRSGGYDIPWIKRHEATDVFEQLENIENKNLRVSVLHDFSVENGPDMCIFRIELSFNPRSERTKGIESLAARAQGFHCLQVACRYIVQAGITQYVFRGIPAPDLFAFLFIFKGQLCFIIELFADAELYDRSFVSSILISSAWLR